jgi:hypothetical protein
MLFHELDSNVSSVEVGDQVLQVALPFVFSLFGLGWSRWTGLVVTFGAPLCALMTLGAMCGPFAC